MSDPRGPVPDGWWGDARWCSIDPGCSFADGHPGRHSTEVAASIAPEMEAAHRDASRRLRDRDAAWADIDALRRALGLKIGEGLGLAEITQCVLATNLTGSAVARAEDLAGKLAAADRALGQAHALLDAWDDWSGPDDGFDCDRFVLLCTCFDELRRRMNDYADAVGCSARDRSEKWPCSECTSNGPHHKMSCSHQPGSSQFVLSARLDPASVAVTRHSGWWVHTVPVLAHDGRSVLDPGVARFDRGAPQDALDAPDSAEIDSPEVSEQRIADGLSIRSMSDAYRAGMADERKLIAERCRELSRNDATSSAGAAEDPDGDPFDHMTIYSMISRRLRALADELDPRETS